jgi:hypothetical protein
VQAPQYLQYWPQALLKPQAPLNPASRSAMLPVAVWRLRQLLRAGAPVPNALRRRLPPHRALHPGPKLPICFLQSFCNLLDLARHVLWMLDAHQKISRR